MTEATDSTEPLGAGHVDPARRSRAAEGSCLLLLLAVACGCGTSDYEQRMEATVKRLQSAGASGARLSEFYTYSADPQPGTDANFRVPKVFEMSYSAESANPDTGMKYHPERVFPAGVRLPGHNLTYEARQADSEKTEWPYFMYVGAARAEPGTLAAVAEQLRGQFKEKVPETPDAWEEVELPVQGGGTLPWKKLRIEGQFMFDKYDPAGVGGFAPYPGVVELYLFEGNNHHVLIGWKTLAQFEQPTRIGPLTRVAASTLQIGGAPPTAPAAGE